MLANYELLPVYIFSALAVLFFAAAVIIAIRSRSSLIGADDKDFIQIQAEKKKRQINASASNITFRGYCIMLVVFPVAVFLAFLFLLHDAPAGIICAIISLFLPDVVVKLTGNGQKRIFEEQYGEALNTLASDLQSGMTIQQAVEDITTNAFGIHESIKKGFRQIDSDIKIGIPVPEAFRRYADETQNKDAADVAAAIAMQSEVGGSEAQVISTISINIKDRIMMRKEMKTLFSDTSVMVNIMGLLPFFMVAFLYFGARQIIEPFFETTEMTILFFAILAFAGFGTFYLRRRLKKAKGGELE